MRPPRLLAVTPPAGPVDPAVVSVWREAGALATGLTVLLRDPGASLEALLAPTGRLGALAAACRAADLPLVASCDAAMLDEAATEVRARGLAGLQLRGDPSSAVLERARTLLPDALLGRSCHGAPGPAEPAPVDYTCFAPVFTPRTQTPDRHKTGVGLEALRRWTADLNAWVVALGGLSPHNASACLQAGARGLAGISLFFGPTPRVAQDVAALVRAL
jgi:thiamine monophosphate synthase